MPMGLSHGGGNIAVGNKHLLGTILAFWCVREVPSMGLFAKCNGAPISTHHEGFAGGIQASRSIIRECRREAPDTCGGDDWMSIGSWPGGLALRLTMSGAVEAGIQRGGQRFDDDGV